MIEYAGVDLCLEDPEGKCAALLDRHLPWEDVRLFCPPPDVSGDRWTALWQHSHILNLPVPQWPEPPKVRFNTLYWPTGASRWSVFLGLCGTAQKNEIIKTVRPRAGGWGYEQLVLSDSAFDTHATKPTDNAFTVDKNDLWALSTAMWMLTPIRLTSYATTTNKEDDLWVIPLVDDRYWWHYRSLPADWITPDGIVDQSSTGAKTWDALVNAIGAQFTGFGATDSTWYPPFVTDWDSEYHPVGSDNAYGEPQWDDFQRWGDSPSLLFDAVAWSVGRRVVRRIDGSIKLQTWSDAETYVFDLLSRNSDKKKTYGTWHRIAGGESIGQSSDDFDEITELAAMRPETVRVVIRDARMDTTSGSFEVTDDAQINPTETVNWQAQNGRITIDYPVTLFGYGDYVPGLVKTIHTPSLNTASLVAVDDDYDLLARQLSYDWLGWTRRRYTQSFAGLKRWLPTGYDDLIEWRLGTRDTDGVCGLETRVKTLPIDFGPNVQLCQVGTQTQWTEDIIFGLLADDLAAASSHLQPSSAQGYVDLPGTGVDEGTWFESSRLETIINRSPDTELSAGDYFIARRAWSEWLLLNSATSATSGEWIRFTILEAFPATSTPSSTSSGSTEASAIVHVTARSCGSTVTDCTEIVWDPCGCFLDEPASLLVGRCGGAKKLRKIGSDPSSSSSSGASSSSSSSGAGCAFDPAATCRYEIDWLCCPNCEY